MKKTFVLTIAAFAIASAAFAQTEAKDSVWAAKQAAKAKKVQDAADLKAFKEKQKADLAAFIQSQKNGKQATDFNAEKPNLVNEEDSLAYIFGIAQSNGLQQYAATQLGVDANHLNKFAEGIIDRAGTDPNDKELAAYNAGGQIGSQVIQMAQQMGKEYYAADESKSVSPNIVAAGIVAGLLGTNEIPVDSASMMFQQKLAAQQAANKEALYGPNRIAGEKFLEENKTKEGVQVTESGLQYKVITMGTGEKPTERQKVNVDYEGRLIDGTVFDSSYKRGQPTTFQVNQVIKGWTEALQLMPVGSKWEIYIPYQLAYGDRATGSDIKPYSALIFTVELHGIEDSTKN
ncbi:MAG: FKBP-type peptidyl-prolyl cis-trans isomerase [Prevotellaceae bacterium]|nr:FKBP-type peptidyl-prolyl cis-trans isomerase [Prevotellaceae bacterium]